MVEVSAHDSNDDSDNGPGLLAKLQKLLQDWPFAYKVTRYSAASGFDTSEVKQLISDEIDRFSGSAVGDAVG